MSLPKCKHGAAADDGRFQGLWNAPFSRCTCCGVSFPYIDSGSYGARGYKTRTWQPKDRCGKCGGHYVDEEYIAPEHRNV